MVVAPPGATRPTSAVMQPSIQEALARAAPAPHTQEFSRRAAQHRNKRCPALKAIPHADAKPPRAQRARENPQPRAPKGARTSRPQETRQEAPAPTDFPSDAELCTYDTTVQTTGQAETLDPEGEQKKGENGERQREQPPNQWRHALYQRARRLRSGGRFDTHPTQNI